MAVTEILQTDTLEQMRVKINSLAASDFGDIATLDSSLSATSVIGAVNEINAVVTSTAGWYLEDLSSSVQAIGSGQTLRAHGTANQTVTTVSAPDTLTISLATNVTIPNNLTVTNNLTASGTTHTLGTIEISGNDIRSTDSGDINFNDRTQHNSGLYAGLVEIKDVSGKGGIRGLGTNKIINFDAWPVFNSYLSFEGSVADGNELDLFCTNPTADRTVTIPDATGTIILDSTTGWATSTIFSTSVSLVIYDSSGVAQKTIVGSST